MPSLDNVKLLLEVNDAKQDAVINLYLSRAENFVMNYCGISEIPNGLQDVVEDIAVIKYRLRGVEGVSSESKGSLSEAYISGIPNDLINQLNTYKKRVIKVI